MIEVKDLKGRLNNIYKNTDLNKYFIANVLGVTRQSAPYWIKNDVSVIKIETLKSLEWLEGFRESLSIMAINNGVHDIFHCLKRVYLHTHIEPGKTLEYFMLTKEKEPQDLARSLYKNIGVLKNE